MEILILAIIILILFVILLFNQIIREENAVNNAYATVDVYLKKRYDLVPNLVEVVKGHAAHEKEVFENVTNLRTKALNAENQESAVETDNKLNAALKDLLLVAEQYPNLQSNTSFIELQKNLLAIEDELSAARRTYNAAVTEFNISLESFPTNIVSKVMRKSKKIKSYSISTISRSW